jgi:carbamoyltransferase
MIVFGINDSSHDAALSVVIDGEIAFAAHSERYNKQKNTFHLDDELVTEALMYGKPDVIAYFEKRAKKRWRRLLHGGVNGAYGDLYSKRFRVLADLPEVQVGHHESHAVAGYFTSPFDDAVIVVLDAVGEWDCTSVWLPDADGVKNVLSVRYPTSFGLFYSAFTHLVGLRPGTDEYILMGMAGFGNPSRFYDRVNSYFPSWDKQRYSFIGGIVDWGEAQRDENWKFDVAAAAQRVYQERLLEFMSFVKMKWPSRNLVFAGGCALNCAANTQLFDVWDNIWIFPNPGDAGSSLGAAMRVGIGRPDWKGPYLGHEIFGTYPVDDIVGRLASDGVVGVACGKAEFGPRALGNRSLLADPRSIANHAAVNEIKKREPFRPFAPVVLEEKASEWFDMPCASSPYMQFAVACKRPTQVPAVVHVDGTSRVQTVNESQNPGLYNVLLRWEAETGIPILLNTSLNIKDQPLLNDSRDAAEWERVNPNAKIARA